MQKLLLSTIFLLSTILVRDSKGKTVDTYYKNRYILYTVHGVLALNESIITLHEYTHNTLSLSITITHHSHYLFCPTESPIK